MERKNLNSEEKIVVGIAVVAWLMGISGMKMWFWVCEHFLGWEADGFIGIWVYLAMSLAYANLIVIVFKEGVKR